MANLTYVDVMTELPFSSRRAEVIAVRIAPTTTVNDISAELIETLKDYIPPSIYIDDDTVTFKNIDHLTSCVKQSLESFSESHTFDKEIAAGKVNYCVFALTHGEFHP